MRTDYVYSSLQDNSLLGEVDILAFDANIIDEIPCIFVNLGFFETKANLIVRVGVDWE